MIFKLIYGPLELQIKPEVGLSIAKTMPKHFLKNSKTVQKTTFLTPKWSKMTPLCRQNIVKNRDLGGLLRTFGAENTSKPVDLGF